MYYTFGQRKGLKLGGMSEPYFVAAKNIDKKEIFVAPLSQQDKYLASNKLKATNLNLITSDFDINNLHAKFRYRQNDIKIFNVVIDKEKNEIIVEYHHELAVTPGQQIVLYENDLCIGGAIIDQVYMNDQKIELLNYKLD